MHGHGLDLGRGEQADLERLVTGGQLPSDQAAGEADRELLADLTVAVLDHMLGVGVDAHDGLDLDLQAGLLPDPLHGQVAGGVRVPEQPGQASAAQQLQPPGLAAGRQGDRVEGLRVHDLRHTAGTLATAAGGSLREVMDRLGHSTTVAAVRYQHVMAERDAAIARELNRLIEGA